MSQSRTQNRASGADITIGARSYGGPGGKALVIAEIAQAHDG